MKKLLLTLALSLMATPAWAGWGIHGGFDFGNSSISPNYSVSQERTGGIVGIQYDLTILDIFTIEPGIQYARRGVNLTNSVETDSIHANYLEIPIFLKLGLPGVIAPFIEAGPNIAFKLSSDCENGGGGGCNLATAFNPNQSNLLWEFGVGVDLNAVNLPTLSVAARYYVGTSDWANFGTTTVYSAKHDGFELVASLAF